MKLSIQKSTSDIVKFICSLVMLSHHILLVFKLSNITKYTHNIGHIVMFAFLFLSGYGLVQSYYLNGMKEYWG